MKAGSDILTEASGSKKGTLDMRVGVRGNKGSVTLLFRRANLKASSGGWGLTIAALKENASELVGDAYTASEAVKRALEGVTVKRNAPTAEEVAVNAGRGGVYLEAAVLLELHGEDLDDYDIITKIRAVTKDWRVPR